MPVSDASEASPQVPLDEVFRKDCPGRPVFEQATGRWGLLILTALEPGALRFYQVRDRVGGISEKMLVQNLRSLARSGLVDREVEPGNLPKVSYSLTPLGRDLAERLRGLIDWSAQNGQEIAGAQQAYDDGLSSGPGQ